MYIDKENHQHLKIQFRILMPDKTFAWSKHISPCGSLQDEIIPITKFRGTSPKDGKCERCLAFAKRIKTEFINGEFPQNKNVEGFADELYSAINYTQIKLVLFKYDVKYWTPKVSFKNVHS